MRRLLHAILLGLLGAGIVHIAALLMVPKFSERNAWSRLAMASDLYKMTRLEAEKGGSPMVKSVDPLFTAAACRFDLAEGMVQIRGPASAIPFWSVSVYDRAGHNIYSFNDHGASKHLLDAVILTPAQMNEVRKDLPEEFQGSVFIEAPIADGIVDVRAFIPDESWTAAVAQFLAATSCDLRQS
jgi:uncharacterized membrane protein